MSPRRCSDITVVNATMGEEIREETTQRREPDASDAIESKNEYFEVEEVVGEQTTEERLLRVVVKLGTREKKEVPMYEGNLNVEELLDWISDFNKYFDYEEIDDEKKVNHVVTRLEGHATLLWDELQADRR
jgi:hypothetical protein